LESSRLTDFQRQTGWFPSEKSFEGRSGGRGPDRRYGRFLLTVENGRASAPHIGRRRNSGSGEFVAVPAAMGPFRRFTGFPPGPCF